jgi:hypothetical protein
MDFEGVSLSAEDANAATRVVAAAAGEVVGANVMSAELLGGTAPKAAGVVSVGVGVGVVVIGAVVATIGELQVQNGYGVGAEKPTWQAIGVSGLVGAAVGVVVVGVGGALMAGGV